jgi:hypothetical protein
MREENDMQMVKTRRRRQHQRSLMIVTAEYSLINSSQNTFSYGIISDMSESGMCLLTTDPLKRGEKIVIKSNPLSKIAAVRWNSEGGLYYKAGLEFV